MQPIHTAEDLEYELSRPTPGVHDALRSLDGDVLVLGAGGKMGPTLARMVRRGLDAIGHKTRRVIAVSRFSSPAAAAGLQQHGVETVACDLLLSVGLAVFWGFPERLTVTGAGAIRGPSFTFDFETWRPVVRAMGIQGVGFSYVVKRGS